MADIRVADAPTLATKEWWGLSLNATVDVLIVEVERREVRPGVWTTHTFENRVRSTLTTTKALFLRNNPNRVAFTLVVLSANQARVLPDADVTSTFGIPVQSDGGSVTVEGNEVKVFGPASARAALEDRNPLRIGLFGSRNPGAAALAESTEWTYTIPAARKFRAGHVFAQVLLNSTVAINARASAFIRVTTGSLAGNAVFQADAETGQASVQVQVHEGLSDIYVAGDVLSGRVFSDNNQAGTDVHVGVALTGTEGGA